MSRLAFAVVFLVGSGCVRQPAEDTPKADTDTPVDTDTADTDPVDTASVPTDADGDGYPSVATGGTDCDDADPHVHPDLVDRCDDVDTDCDGRIDEDTTTREWYPDADGDGYGSAEAALVACGSARAGYALEAGDCDDADAARSPGHAETCNGVDDNCDGTVDESADADGDGQRLCDGDCDDTVATVHVGAPEACDGVDSDCDGVVPPGEADADGDGWRLCDADCDDADATVSPGGVETCDDGVDEDCDGRVDADCAGCDVSVPNDHASIQDALDHASPGDVICVAAGDWYEDVDFGGAEVTVVGVHGAARTTIIGGEWAPAVTFQSGEGPGATLRGFTLTHDTDYEYGLSIDGASPTLEDLVVTGNSGGWYGGGVYVADGAPTFTRVEITDNEAYAWWCAASYGDGAGIAAYRSDVVLDDVRVTDNYAGYHGGGVYLSESTAVLTNVTVADNYAEGGAGGLYLYESSATLTNVRVTDNATSTYWGLGSDPVGGGLTLFRSDATFTNVLVSGNDDDIGAGGVYLYDSTLTVVNSIVTGNGGGLYVRSGDAPTLAYSNVWWNGFADFTGMADPTGTDGNVSVDPVLLAGGQLDATSPLVDAGDPTLLDPDGSRSDIGAYGGPGASSWDADLDGWPAWWLPGPWDPATSPDTDCDDDTGAVYPESGC